MGVAAIAMIIMMIMIMIIRVLHNDSNYNCNDSYSYR